MTDALRVLTGRKTLTTVVLLAAGFVMTLVAGLVPGLSALLLAILVGALLRNVRVVPPRVASDVPWSSKKTLRIGIVLLGFKLSLSTLLDIGPGAILVLLLTVAVTFLATLGLGRLLRVSAVSRLLIATGFSICGASAVVAMSSVADPDGKAEEDTAQAVALVTIFGTIAMFALPALATALELSPLQSGVWIGASVHEVAQVVAAGGMVSAAALVIATTAKLGRVVLLAPLLIVVSAVASRRGEAQVTRAGTPIVPLFVVGFLAAVLLRTFLPLPEPLLAVLELATNVLLAAAMLGLGFGVDIKRLIATGWRPLILGAFSTAIAAGVSLSAIFALGLA